MKKVGYLLLAMLLSIALLAGCSSVHDNDFSDEETDLTQPEVVAGELVVSVEGSEEIVGFTDEEIVESAGVRAKSQGGLLADLEGIEVKDSLPGSYEQREDAVYSLSAEMTQNIINNMGFVHTLEFSENYDSFEEAAAKVRDTLEANGYEVRHVEPNYEYEAFGEVDAAMHSRQEWHYNMVNAPEAWNVDSGDRSVSIAILDTGIDYDHNDLDDYVDENQGASFVDNDPMDRNGHGTHVAGTVASYNNVSGVMREATLIPVKVLGDSGGGSLQGIQRGILHAADVGADVINMSLGGGGYSDILAEACETAYNSGTVLVAASGNSGRSPVAYPSGYRHVISVGAVDSSEDRASFSNYGEDLNVVAPGVNIYSTYPNNSYETLSGTSMASPHAAGVAGLIRSADPDLSVSEVWSIMEETAQEVGSSYYYGEGIVDAYASVKEAGGEDPDDPEDPGDDPDDPEDPEPEPDPDPEPQIVALQNRYSDKVVSRVRGWWRAYIQEHTWQGADSQKWELKDVEDGYYALINQNSGEALDIDGSSIVENEYQNVPEQQWRLVDLGNGYYAVQNRSTGNVLHGDTYSDELYQYSWWGGANQQWNIAQLSQLYEMEEEDLEEAKGELEVSTEVEEVEDLEGDIKSEAVEKE